ncbi:MAG: SsrA-binding protein SmpB [Aquificaceae bacterium]|nr:SsrA-binding protein SmpB [Aquificaceae bacterium]MCS7195980.1 SsrA-binding protein SmpB [Aquificaceae bacterium]MCX7989546.1 SsrA-binding protein SmpB [Aquificaceae bacterium]MDW8032671.1 SsrA-binding protein SmpB [Aquificaceae bacterium]MDW8295102.1 SsrA-binding protein SmpB [Aquificaceae bacterium]
MPKQSGELTVAYNKEAKAEYEIIETYEAGIVLEGPEVKALRNRQTVSFKDSFVRIQEGEAWLYNLYIAPYKYATIKPPDPLRNRKLLLHKREILKLFGKVREKGYTLIPLRLYFKEGRVKVEIALVKGKKAHDRREELRQRDLERQLRRELKEGKIKL